VIKYGNSATQDREPVSDGYTACHFMVADDPSKPLPRELRRFASVLVHAADFVHHADITLQGIPRRDYALRLFIQNEELGLQTQDNRTWIPARRQYVPCLPHHVHLSMAVHV
jgi:hypothetical protein